MVKNRGYSKVIDWIICIFLKFWIVLIIYVNEVVFDEFLSWNYVWDELM